MSLTHPTSPSVRALHTGRGHSVHRLHPKGLQCHRSMYGAPTLRRAPPTSTHTKETQAGWREPRSAAEGGGGRRRGPYRCLQSPQEGVEQGRGLGGESRWGSASRRGSGTAEGRPTPPKPVAGLPARPQASHITTQGKKRPGTRLSGRGGPVQNSPSTPASSDLTTGRAEFLVCFPVCVMEMTVSCPRAGQSLEGETPGTAAGTAGTHGPQTAALDPACTDTAWELQTAGPRGPRPASLTPWAWGGDQESAFPHPLPRQLILILRQVERPHSRNAAVPGI